MKFKIKPETVYLALSFFIPFFILVIIFALNGVYPFGDKLVIYSDIEHMTFPGLSNTWHKLRTGSISTWSWTAGLGHGSGGFIGFLNPFTLAYLLPYKWLSEALTFSIITRISLAGLFMGIYLRYMFGKNSLTLFQLRALPVFSSLYALCAFTIGYFHFESSFLSIALLPLVIMGLSALIKEDKYRLYIISLALAVFYDYYIGMFICIFVAITFFSQCIIQKLNFGDFLRKLGLIAACSALALAINAVNILPFLIGMQSAAYFTETIPTSLSLYHSFFSILGNFIAFTPPTILEGLPNLYSGMICVLLLGLFVYSSKVSMREKIITMGIIVFLLISTNISILDYIIHGFRYPNMLPSRFSFIISFILVVIAYRMYITSENMSWREFAVIGISAAVFLLSAVFGSQEKNYIIGSAVLCVVYLVLLFVISKGPKKILPFVKTAFLLVILAELFVTSYFAFSSISPSFQKRTPWFLRIEAIQNVLNLRQRAENDFYRTEIDMFYNYNQPLLFNYDGISRFTTGINENLRNFATWLGMPFYKNGIYYADVTPLFNAFFNVLYLIVHENNYKENNNIYWENTGKAETVLLMENRRHLPLGFMVNEELADFKLTDYIPFKAQNDFFSLATGIELNLFQNANVSIYNREEMYLPTVAFTVQNEGMYYCNIVLETKYADINIFVNDELVRSFIDLSSCVFPIGYLFKGDEVSLQFSANYGEMLPMMTCVMDTGLFEMGYNILASQPLHLTKFSDTQVCGYVEAFSDGLLYTSIPADRNWSVYVDGVKSEIVPIADALIGVRLVKGYHEIEFRYFNRVLFISSIISLVSVASFVILVIVKRRRA